MNEKAGATTILVVGGPRFYARGDEKSFFDWLTAIDGVLGVRGVGRELQIECAGRDLPDNSLRELIALLFRYRVDMRPLRPFVTADNAGWFRDNAQAYWHPAVFGDDVNEP